MLQTRRFTCTDPTHNTPPRAWGPIHATPTGVPPSLSCQANELFRQGSFDFFGIPKVIEQTMEAHRADFKSDPTLDDILQVDAWAREQVVAEADRISKAPVLL